MLAKLILLFSLVVVSVAWMTYGSNDECSEKCGKNDDARTCYDTVCATEEEAEDIINKAIINLCRHRRRYCARYHRLRRLLCRLWSQAKLTSSYSPTGCLWYSRIRSASATRSFGTETKVRLLL